MIKSWKIFRENIDPMGLFGIIFQSFLSNSDLDDDPTENDLDGKPSRENVLKQFKQPVRKLCVMFVLSVIPIFDSFNTFLQAEEPLIHILYHSTLRLHRSLLSRFILPRGGSRAAATSKMERFVIIVNGFQLPAVNYYHKALHLGCYSSPRSASAT